MSFHEFTPRGDVHGIHYWTYATIADRDAHNPSEGPTRAFNAGDALQKRVCLVEADWSWWALVSISPAVWKPIGGGGGSGDEQFQQDLLDNDSTYIVVGDRTVDKTVEIVYSFQLPISGRQRNGKLTLSHDGSTPTLDEDYYFEIGDEITSVVFGATISGDELRITIVTSSVGENPKLVYRRIKLGVAA
jgi:hypothetical protein